MRIICGVDTGKAWLDAWMEPAGHRRFANTPAGAAGLLAWCGEHGAELVVMEASGGVEQAAFLALWRGGQPAAIANPRAVRCFAQAMGHLEQTDRIDAAVIAGWAAAKRVVPTPPPSDDQRRLTALAARARQVAADLSVQKQRLASAADPAARASLAEAIGFFAGQARSLATQIAALVAADPVWHALDRTIRSVKGLADRTVAVLLADLPELGTLSNKAISKLVGLAPLANDSGQRHGARAIRGGRASVRSILYLVADVARRYDPDLDAFRQRLLAQGKAKMTVRIALAHKLLVRLNAKARDTRACLHTA